MGYAERSYSYRFGGGSDGFGRGSGGGLTGSLTPWVRRLLIANGAVWLLNAVGLLPHAWTVRTFGFSPGSLLFHPWSPVTYMFVHGGFWHLFVNMLVLFFFGPPLERAWGSREFLKFYLVSGLGGALISLLFLPLPVVEPATTVVGASGAIFGVMLAFALMWPDARIYVWGILPVRAKWFVAALAFFTLYATFAGGGGNVAHWTHLGGLVTGIVYLRHGERMSRVLDRAFSWVGKAGDRVMEVGGRREDSAADGSRREEPRRRPRRSRKVDRDGSDPDTLDEVDRILDKIREEGLDSLTEEERAFLDEMSRRYRG